MKHFFYTILLVASLGTVGAILNPSLAQQGAALLGLEFPWIAASSEETATSEDQVDQFLAQYPYPFVNNQNNAIVSSAAVPMISYPEPAPAAMLPVYAAPIAPFPTPVAETFAPVYVAPVAPEPVQSPTDWDSAATTPIAPPPTTIESFFSMAPVQEPVPVPAPQQSVYVPTSITEPFQSVSATSVSPQQALPSTEDPQPVGFASTREAAQQPIQIAMVQPHVPHVLPPTTATLQTPAVLIEDVPMHGTEIVARVGTQFILMGDILPKLRRTALKIISMNLDKMPAEERAKVPQQEIEQVFNTIAANLYPDVLQEQILFTLVYCDYISQQNSEQRNFFNGKLGEEFDRKEVPELLKEFRVENVVALKQYLEHQLGSSLDKEKQQWIREQIVRQWIGMSIDKAAPAATQDEMLDFYEKNQAMFTSTARARWQEMVVLFSQHGTEKEAWDKIKWMGNQVANGASSFEVMARTKSDGFTSSEDGVWDWTTKGSLTSAELEQAIFSQLVGQLSPAIIKSDRGLHIIKVLERKEAMVTPFIEAQVIIREKIKNQRTQRQQDEYLTELRRRFPTVVVRDRIDFDVNTMRTASNRPVF